MESSIPQCLPACGVSKIEVTYTERPRFSQHSYWSSLWMWGHGVIKVHIIVPICQLEGSGYVLIAALGQVMLALYDFLVAWGQIVMRLGQTMLGQVVTLSWCLVVGLGCILMGLGIRLMFLRLGRVARR